MITLSKGYQLPQTGDPGNTFFPALEQNIQQMNSHKHDGVDGEKPNSKDILTTSVSVLVGAFSLQPNGEYRATVSNPSSIPSDTTLPTLRDPVTKEIVYGRIEKATGISYYVYVNIPLNLEVVYGV